ncbi:MAG: tetratricopeptide repeat protein [Candidatus Lindowbacteria bacterium]|nr:tetratricopeptide repeat protein [Candidatus Lindowbacteria bacterium]
MMANVFNVSTALTIFVVILSVGCGGTSDSKKSTTSDQSTTHSISSKLEFDIEIDNVTGPVISLMHQGEFYKAERRAELVKDQVKRAELLAEIYLATDRSVDAVNTAGKYRTKENLRAVYIRALQAASDKFLKQNKAKVARMYLLEWARLEPENELPQALITSSADKGEVVMFSNEVVTVKPLDIVVLSASATSGDAENKEKRKVVLETNADRRIVEEKKTQPNKTISSTPKPPALSARAKSRGVEKKETKPKKAIVSAPPPPARVLKKVTLETISEAVQGGKYRLAEKHARNFIRENPENFTAWNLLGICQMQLKNRKAAVESFRKSIKINRDQPEVKMAIDELSIPE